jgi:hypothetical protein
MTWNDLHRSSVMMMSFMERKGGEGGGRVMLLLVRVRLNQKSLPMVTTVSCAVRHGTHGSWMSMRAGSVSTIATMSVTIENSSDDEHHLRSYQSHRTEGHSRTTRFRSPAHSLPQPSSLPQICFEAYHVGGCALGTEWPMRRAHHSVPSTHCLPKAMVP